MKLLVILPLLFVTLSFNTSVAQQEDWETHSTKNYILKYPESWFFYQNTPSEFTPTVFSLSNRIDNSLRISIKMEEYDFGEESKTLKKFAKECANSYTTCKTLLNEEFTLNGKSARRVKMRIKGFTKNDEFYCYGYCVVWEGKGYFLNYAADNGDFQDHLLSVEEIMQTFTVK